MATVKNDDVLVPADRKVIISALEMKAASVLRAAKSEANSAIQELRNSEYQAILALVNKVSNLSLL